MNPPGRRFFLAGTIGLLVFGSLHCLAVYDAYFGRHEKPEEKAFEAAARAVSEPMGPFRPTALDAMQLLNVCFSILVFQAALLSWIILRNNSSARTLRRTAAANSASMGLICAASLAHQFPPPLAVGAIVFVLFATAWWRLRNAVSATT